MIGATIIIYGGLIAKIAYNQCSRDPRNDGDCCAEIAARGIASVALGAIIAGVSVAYHQTLSDDVRSVTNKKL